jgi:hypothetical protein
MKRLLVVVTVLCSMGLMAQTSHFKSKLDGASASLITNVDPFTQISMQVNRGSINNVPNTNIVFIYAVFSQDFSTLTFTQIFGPIPDSAFTGDNTQGLHLNLDTSTLDPAVTFSETCTLDEVTFNFLCGATQTGVIQLDFIPNGASSTQVITSESVQTIGPDTIRMHQSSFNASANASGSIFGTSVAVSGGTVSLNKNSTIEVTRF